MIISRQNYKQAYLTFLKNGTIRLNKKTIGIWNKTIIKQNNNIKTLFIAKVHYNKNSRVQLSNENKLKLMLTIGKNIPDSMLTPAIQS